MNLQELIKQNKLERFETPISEVKKRLEKGRQSLEFAKASFKKDTPESFLDFIYKNIYDGIRFMGEAYLLLNGYRAKVTDHHKTVITVTRELMKEEDMKNVLKRLNKMRKKRNDLDYDFDTYGTSRTAIAKAFEDAEKFEKKISEAIEDKDLQQKLQ